MTQKESSNDIAVSVKNVTKDFILPHESTNSLKSRIVNFYKRKDKGYEIQHALRGISFDVKKGEFFGIFGRNGSGKSTLLKIIAQIYQPTNGNIKVKGKLVPFIELGVGFNPELTGRENVYLNGALLGFSRKEIDDRYDDIVKFAELGDFMDQKLKNYSSGMQVRLAFSVATRAEADILVVDEVLAVGDADFQRKCYDYFKSLKKNKKTVIFVTHSMDAAKEYCDRAILIKDGKIAVEGKAKMVADEYLKMFNNNNVSNKRVNKDRWGSNQVKITDIDIKNSEDGSNLILTVNLKANQDGAKSFIFEYRFTDSEERLVMGGSSLDARNGSELSLGPNKTCQLRFNIINVFNKGAFTLGATVKLADDVTICDNWDNIKNINVFRNEVKYPIMAPAEMEVEGVNKLND